MRTKLIAALPLIVFLGCSPFGKFDAVCAQASYQASDFNPATAVDDARRASEARDFRVLAVQRYSIFLPGVKLSVDEVEKTYGYRVIEGTSDNWPTKAVAEFNRRATDYARAYNAEILKLGAATR